VIRQVPVPLQPDPNHPENIESAAGVAVNMTGLFMSYVAIQVVPHAIPAGLDRTVPVPVPAFVTVKSKVFRVKIAVTVFAASIVRVQALVPRQSPDQPENRELNAGVGVSVTIVLISYVAVQVVPQFTPMGSELMLPLPEPEVRVVREKDLSINTAVVVLAPSILTTQEGSVPLQPPPDHPTNMESLKGVALSVTVVLMLYVAVQVAPQSIPGISDVTVPFPVPDLAIVIGKVLSVNVAVTVLMVLTVTTQEGSVPVQPPPDHPENSESKGVAVSVIVMLSLYATLQVAPQLMPAGLEKTSPAPLPALDIVREKGFR